MYNLSVNSQNHLKGVHPVLKNIIETAILTSPYDFGVSEGLRSTIKQYNYYLDGLSQLDGYVNKSYHQTGHAVDIFGYYNGGLTYDDNIMLAISNHIKKVARELYGIEITWGGDWISFVDKPHFQISRNTPKNLKMITNNIIENETKKEASFGIIFIPAIFLVILWFFDKNIFKKLI